LKKQVKRIFLKLSSLALIISFLSACISTKDWKENQYLLVGQSIKGYQSVDYYDLEGLFRQETNRRILGTTPYVWIYNVGKKIYKTEEEYDSLILHYEETGKTKRAKRWKKRRKKKFTTKKFDDLILKHRDNSKKVKKYSEKKRQKQEDIKLYKTQGSWLMRVAGEAPVFYDSLLIQETADEIEAYYKTKGFFNAKVKIERKRKEKRKRILITYKITENIPTLINDIEYLSLDTNIATLISSNLKESDIKVGNNYDESKIDKERVRLEQVFRNNGYFDFNREFIVFEVDTNIVDTTQIKYKKANIDVIIRQPTDSTNHKIYILDEVDFYTKAGIFADTTIEKSTTFKKINYNYKGKGVYFSPKILDTRIKIKPETKYSFEQTLETQRALLNLEMFKFVNVRFDLDKETDFFKASIFTSPLDKYQISVESGLNVSQGLPGPFVSLSFKNRNPFRGCEIFETSFQFTIDGQTSFSDENQFYSSQEIIINSSLTFPQLLFPTRLRFKFDRYNPSTKVGLGLNLVERPEYSRNNLQASISYRGRRRYSSYNFTLAELSIVNTMRIDEAFQEQLDLLLQQGNPLIFSFDRAFVSSSYVTYTFNNAENPDKSSSQYLRVLLESGGTIGNLLNQSIGENDRIFGLRFFQFLKTSVGFHYNYPFGREDSQAIAFRLFGGIANPTGSSTTLPYEKFFFAGGASSLRAWQPRRLGPGSFTPERDGEGNFDYRFEQPGEISLEANIEYRFPMISFIEGALFLDAGNVWTIDEVPNRPGSQFTSSFFEEIAIGTGFGIRFDFSFLILRADFGVKVYDPAEAKGSRFVLPTFNWTNPFGRNQTVLNIGIGYPF